MIGNSIVVLINKWIKKSCKPILFANKNIAVSLADTSSLDEAKQELTACAIEISVYGLELNINISPIYCNTKLFFTLSDFQYNFKLDFCNYNIGILNINGRSYFHDKDSMITYIESQISSSHIIKNAISYIEFREFLKSESFADYFNLQNQEIILYSTEKGIKKIKIAPQIIIFDENQDYSILISQLIERLRNIDYRNQFKMQLYSLERISDSDSSDMQAICNNINQLCEITENYYNIWSKQFSFSSLISDLRLKKDKYFISLREILSKILSQATSVPIAISASVFATYKVNEPIILYIILIAFMGYALFAIAILMIYDKDVKNILSDFENDLIVIKRESGLSIKDIENESSKIINKISLVKYIIRGLIILFIILSSLFLFFILYMLKVAILKASVLSTIYLMCLLLCKTIYVNLYTN